MLTDAILAGLCLLLCEVAVWSGTIRGPHVANAVLLGAVAASVMVRSVAPVGAVAIATVALAVQVTLFGATETAGLMITFIALAYSVAARTRGWSLVIGLGGLVSVGLLHEARDPDIHTFVDALFVPLVIAVPAALGYAAAQVRARADLAEQHARMAEEARDTAALLAAGQERERIARELHDILAHSVSVMVVQAEAAEELLERAPEQARGPVTAVQRTGREALTELRMLLGTVRTDGDPELAPQPGLTQLPDLVQAHASAGQPVRFEVDGELPPLSPVVGTTVYRVVQEALTNVRKHAPGAECVIAITATSDRVGIDIVNPTGSGSAPPRGDHGGMAGGHGLIGMRERVELCGGTFQAGFQDSGTFRVRVELPIGRP